jgi:hypothetical protein
VQNYSADILDDEPTLEEKEAGRIAHIELRALELRALGVDELKRRADVALEEIFVQLSNWGEEVSSVIGDRLVFDGDVPEFTSRDYWLCVEKVFVDFGMEWPFEPVGPIPFELAALSRALVDEMGKSELMPYAGRQIWVGYMYDFFEKNRADIIASL